MLVFNELLSFGFLDGVSNPLIAGFDRTVPGPAPIDASNILTGFTNDKDWTRDGSFLVFRYLFQKVPEFNNFLRANALKIHPITSQSLDPTDGSELLGARLVGRWKSGKQRLVAPSPVIILISVIFRCSSRFNTIR